MIPNTEVRGQARVKEYRGKRLLDLSILLSAHLLLLPFWVIVWILIPLAILVGSGRPVFFRQERVGLGGRPFITLKFRTMKTRRSDEDWPIATLAGDERVTPLGKILRRTALDELPQVLNILRGDISFVGPRPLVTEQYLEDVETVPRFVMRSNVRPGLTGVAQIYLPRHCGPRHRLAYDRFYIRNASLWLDIKLILRSGLFTIFGRWGTGTRTIVD